MKATLPFLVAAVLIAFSSAGCSGSSCSESEAYNKMLAINSVQGRLIANGSPAGMLVANSMTADSSMISELIAAKNYGAACAKADEVASKLKIDLAQEMKGMITYEQLKADGGKGSGTCSVADAAQKNMEVHGLLQAEVDAGRMASDIFRTFNDDTKGLAEMYSTNPTAACDLLEKLKVKYKLKK